MVDPSNSGGSKRSAANIEDSPSISSKQAEQHGKRTKIEDLYDKKRKEARRFFKQAKRFREVVDQSMANNRPLEDREIRTLYGAIKSNIIRIVRKFFNGAIAIIPADNDSHEGTGNNDGKSNFGLDSKDRHSQVEFFSDWNHRGEIRVLRISGKIFRLLSESIFKVSCFGTDIEIEKGLAQFEATLQQPTGML